MSDSYEPKIKRSIKPVTLTVVLKAGRINENGTFLGFEVVSLKGPNDTFKASFPPKGGGSIYLKVDTLEGITVMADGNNVGSATKPKPKLFT